MYMYVILHGWNSWCKNNSAIEISCSVFVLFKRNGEWEPEFNPIILTEKSWFPCESPPEQEACPGSWVPIDCLGHGWVPSSRTPRQRTDGRTLTYPGCWKYLWVCPLRPENEPRLGAAVVIGSLSPDAGLWGDGVLIHIQVKKGVPRRRRGCWVIRSCTRERTCWSAALAWILHFRYKKGDQMEWWLGPLSPDEEMPRRGRHSRRTPNYISGPVVIRMNMSGLLQLHFYCLDAE